MKDLEAMKRAGINRAFIGNIGLGELATPYAPVKLFTDEWWEVTHAALKRASELGIEIGMFNSPGWSQAGGPWIEPGQAMRYLASVKAHVRGGGKVEVELPRPSADFQDVRVVAYPGSRRGACGADGGRYACDGCRHGCRGAMPHRRRPGDGAPLRRQPRSRHRLGDGRRPGSAQHHGVARPPSDTCPGRIAGEGGGRLPDGRIVRDRPLEPQYRGRFRPLRPGFGQRGEDHGARVPAHSPRRGEGYGFGGGAALVAAPCGALCGEDLCQDVPVAAALLGGVPVGATSPCWTRSRWRSTPRRWST